MNSFTEGMRRRSSNAETIAEQWEGNAYLSGKYSGVTGSDQTGASIHGYREDTRFKEPNDEWTDGERRLYEFHLKNNPKEAEEYAIRTNNRHNRKAHDAELQEITEGTAQHGIAAAIGARAANAINGLDFYNKALEKAAIGRNNVSRNPSLTELGDAVDEANEANISKKYGEFAGKGYRYGTIIADIALGKSALPKEFVPTKSVVNTLGKINEMYQDSGASSVWEFAKDTSDEIKSIEVGSREWFAEKHEEIEKQTSEYMKRGLSEKTARWKTTKELIEQSFR